MPRPLNLICAAALLMGAAAAAPAAAQQVQSEVVYYGDLDLWSAEGADALIQRIENAADRVCGDAPGPAPVAIQQSIRACEFETVDFTIFDLAHPAVTARHRGVSPEVIVEEGSYDPYNDPYYQNPYLTVRKK